MLPQCPCQRSRSLHPLAHPDTGPGAKLVTYVLQDECAQEPFTVHQSGVKSVPARFQKRPATEHAWLHLMHALLYRMQFDLKHEKDPVRT